jgi:DNA invertase Pin-like site-specific DNA recombinase
MNFSLLPNRVSNNRNSKKGVLHHNAKLNEDAVIQIKKLLSNGVTQQKIADKFSVSRELIKEIKAERVWKYILVDKTT